MVHSFRTLDDNPARNINQPKLKATYGPAGAKIESRCQRVDDVVKASLTQHTHKKKLFEEKYEDEKYGLNGLM